jgi:hypothetical protein
VKYIFVLLALFLPLLVSSAAPTDRYVAPYGNGSACTPDSPCALTSMLVGAGGGTVWLLPGTYAGSFTANAPGTSYRSVPGTRATINGSLSIIAPDTTWQDLEITITNWPNRTTSNGSTLYIYGARTKVLDSWIHDLADGVGFWRPAIDAELSGNLIYNNGYGQNTGHSIYAQNVLGTGRKRIKDNVIGPAYGYGLHVYSSGSANAASGFEVDRNVVLDQFLVGGNAPSGDIRVTNNLLLGSGMRLGYTATNTDVVLLDNTVVSPSYAFMLYRWQSATVRDNTFISTAGNFMVDHIAATPHVYDFAGNTYRYGGSYSQPFGSAGFAGWRATTEDITSVYTPTLPLSTDVRVWATRPHRGIVSVLNWTQAQTVTVDMTQLGLTPGASYQLVNALNPAETLPFVAGGPVAVPTGGWSVAPPYGATAPLRTFDPRFLVFLAEPV